MSRLAAVLVLALALFQGSALEVGLGEMACAEEHHDGDESSSDCPPECATCPCCARTPLAPVGTAVAGIEPDPAARAYAETALSSVPSPPPRGILHVPKSTA